MALLALAALAGCGQGRARLPDPRPILAETPGPGTLTAGSAANVLAADTVAPGTVAAKAVAPGTHASDAVAAKAVAPGTHVADTVAAKAVAAGTHAADTVAAKAVAPGTHASDTVAAKAVAAGTHVADTVAAKAVAPGSHAADTVPADNLGAGAPHAAAVDSGASGLVAAPSGVPGPARGRPVVRRWVSIPFTTPWGGIRVPLIAVAADSFAHAGPPLPYTLRMGRLGDLSAQLRGEAGLGGAWQRVNPCSRALSLRCDSPLVPKLEPNVALAVLVRGTLLGRVRVDVDYDPARGAAAANRFHLSYAGRPGEVLRRVEAGTVSLAVPASQYLARGAPPSASGVLVTGRLGAGEVQATWARQSTRASQREFRRAAGGGVAQEMSAATDDAAYAAGRFFFLFDPAEIRGHPHVDVLGLTPASAPPGLVPRTGVQLFRYTAGAGEQNGSAILLRAVPRDPLRAGETVTGPFRLLTPGTDYQLHRSGAWVMLRTPLGDDEALATAYVSAAGTQVGDTDAPAGGAVREVRLLKGLRATHQPGSSTWPLEMRQVYALPTDDEVDAGSVRLVISRGEAGAGDLGRTPPGGGRPIPYLKLFGLDDAAPAGTVDAARLFQPGRGEAAGGLRGTYVVLPTLRPFAVPPPVPGERLSAEEAAAALGSAANPDIYEAADPRDRRAAAQFRLAFTFRRRGAPGGETVFSLGATSVREGSERVYVGKRLLRRGTDYDILYDVGEVQLRDPAVLAGLGSDSELRITFDDGASFAASPVSVAGLAARFPLGGRGEVSLLGVSQREQKPLRRPPVGEEPRGMLFGGGSGQVGWDAPWLTRAVDALPLVSDSTRSEVRLTGELVASAPAPGSGGVGYLDDFEGSNDFSVPLLRQAWRLGSAPSTVTMEAGAALDASSAGTLAWQHDYRDADGRVVTGVRTAEVDTLLRVTQGGRLSAALHLSMERGGAGPVWRSVTTVLSPAGRDLRDHAYLEFYARGGGPGDQLLVDLGTVSEDAVVADAQGRTGGTDAAGEPWGAGVLDREWDPSRETWTGAHDERGLWAADCRAEPGAAYPLGDPRANCTRGNGAQDSEDLDANGVLDTTERAARYRVELGDGASPYLVRDSTRTGTRFRLYRIPLHGDGGIFTDRGAVRHLRLALVTRDGVRLSLARMRFVGSEWRKRNAAGALRGLAGRDSAAGRLEVGHVSRVSAEDGYVSPPGIADRLQNPGDGAAQLGSGEYNERSLRLRYAGVGPGDRVEAAMPLGDTRSLLPYREIRLWALARRGTWGEGAEELLVRVGSGAGGHYLFRTRLRPVPHPQSAADWGAEVVIDLRRWQRLRGDARTLAAGRGDEGARTVWDADSTYAVVMQGAGPPNLAAVREISLAVWNRGGGDADGEVWIDDLRLTGGDPGLGAAGRATLAVRAGRVLRGDFSVTRQTGRFQHYGGSPTFSDDATAAMDVTLEAGAFAPAAWGLSAPVQLHYVSSGADPLFLPGSDLPVSEVGLARRPRQRAVEVRVNLRKTLASRSPIARALFDPARLDLEWVRAERGTGYADSRGDGLNAVLGYEIRPRARSFPLLPFALRLPWGAGEAAVPRLRWTPSVLSLTQELVDSRDEQFTYSDLLQRSDSARAPVRSRNRRLVQQMALGFQPLGSLAADVVLRSTRDLLPLEADTAAGGEEPGRSGGARVLGVRAGREASRSVTSQVGWNPAPASWLSLETTARGTFELDQEVQPYAPGDTAAPVRDLALRRDATARLRADPQRLLALLVSVPADSARGAGAALLRALAAAAGPVEIGWSSTLQSRFERTVHQPGLAHHVPFAPATFRGAGGDSASVASSVTGVNARTRLAFPSALALGIAFDRVRTGASGTRSGLAEETRSWPDLALSWSPAALPGPLGAVMHSFSLSSGYRRQSTRRDDEASGQAHGTSALSAPLQVTARWAFGLVTSLQSERMQAVSTSPSASVHSASHSQSLTVGGAVPLPAALLGFRPGAPLSLSLSLRRASRMECRPSSPQDGCSAREAYARYLDRSAVASADTRISGIGVGVQADYSQLRSMVGEPAGTRRLQVGLFARFDLGSAGAARTP